MDALIKVHGKAQNRTALGIMHAYLEIYPDSTLDDMKAAFPEYLNPDSGPKSIFKTPAEIKKQMKRVDWNGYFTDDDCLLKFKDGTKAAVNAMWTKERFEKLVAHAKRYGIEVASFEAAEKGFGKKGRYYLEYLRPLPNQKKKMPKALIFGIIGAVIVAVLLALLLSSGNKKPQIVTVIQRDTVTVVKIDTVYVKQVEEIAKNFNAAKFALNSSELNDDAKFALYDLVKVMEKNSQLKILIQGHTSDEGNADYNQQLSVRRAKAAVDFLVSKGIAADRLSYEGKGSSDPIDPVNREVNRRTEFIVIE